MQEIEFQQKGRASWSQNQKLPLNQNLTSLLTIALFSSNRIVGHPDNFKEDSCWWVIYSVSPQTRFHVSWSQLFRIESLMKVPTAWYQEALYLCPWSGRRKPIDCKKYGLKAGYTLSAYRISHLLVLHVNASVPSQWLKQHQYHARKSRMRKICSHAHAHAHNHTPQQRYHAKVGR